VGLGRVGGGFDHRPVIAAYGAGAGQPVNSRARANFWTGPPRRKYPHKAACFASSAPHRDGDHGPWTIGIASPKVRGMSNNSPPDIIAIFGEILYRYRSERDISQEELAFDAGVDRTFISRLERGMRQPTITTLIGLGQALNVSAADMVQETEKLYLKQALSASGLSAGGVKEKKKPYSTRLKSRPKKPR
jgi:transcriptional regulator with XRE-family HTH domain